MQPATVSATAAEVPFCNCLEVIEKYGAPGGTRTPDLLVRSQTLYPTELRARSEFILPRISKGFHRAAGIGTTLPRATEPSSGSRATPPRNATALPEFAGTRSPGTTIPTRFSGSAAER